jgi:hypothetical protein
MAETKSAGAGRGFVNPQRTDEPDETYVTPEQRYGMEKQREEDRMMRGSEREYNKLMPKKMAKGGTASSRADGIAARGKTRGKIVMCGGGMAKGKK